MLLPLFGGIFGALLLLFPFVFAFGGIFGVLLLLVLRIFSDIETERKWKLLNYNFCMKTPNNYYFLGEAFIKNEGGEIIK